MGAYIGRGKKIEQHKFCQLMGGDSSVSFLIGNGVTLIVDNQQLDKCNNNLAEENEALGKPRNKTSETLSKHSSNSSSGPLSSSSSTLSSSSDVVSTGDCLHFAFSNLLVFFTYITAKSSES